MTQDDADQTHNELLRATLKRLGLPDTEANRRMLTRGPDEASEESVQQTLVDSNLRWFQANGLMPKDPTSED